MYVPPAFRADDPALLRSIMVAHPFATLVSVVDGEPFATPVPLLVEEGALLGHVARANPHAAALPGARALAVFHGPHAYVSPRWYTQPAGHVPTWNYVTVHAAGVVEPLDAAGTLDVLERLVAQEEARFDPPWRADPEVLRRLAPAVFAFRLQITCLEGKLKLSQNRAPADAAGAAAGLAAGGPEERAVADWMERAGVLPRR